MKTRQNRKNLSPFVIIRENKKCFFKPNRHFKVTITENNLVTIPAYDSIKSQEVLTT